MLETLDELYGDEAFEEWVIKIFWWT
jgi:hypothetical protein